MPRAELSRYTVIVLSVILSVCCKYFSRYASKNNHCNPSKLCSTPTPKNDQGAVKLYTSLCPDNVSTTAFYLQPLPKPRPSHWFSSKPLGHNTLNHMVKEMCSAAGIKGHKTNHSLRATAATRLFHAGIDEQLIMERTGHHSVDGVRSYKRTSQQQVKVLSDVLNLSAAKTPKRVKVATQQQESTCRFYLLRLQRLF